VDNLIKYSRIPLAIAFFIALLDLPYGYYELLRTVGMVLFIAYGIHNYKDEQEAWSYFWFGSAVLINPIFKIALGAVLWKVVDVIWGVILLYKYNEE
jgi:hypothetical protein